MIYTLDSKMPFKHIVLYGLQELFAILVATVLICSICSVPISAGFVGAGLSTLVYILITKGQSNVYVSNSGAYVAPVIFAFAVGGATAALIGGITICVIYTIFGVIFSKFSIDSMYKVLPKPLIAAVTILIGINLIGYVPTYLGDSGMIGTVIALTVAAIIVLVMAYGNKFLSTLPFLIAVLVGYVICLGLTISGTANMIDFGSFANLHFVAIPDFNFLHFGAVTWNTIISVIIMYAAFSFSGICEVIADHQAMSLVINDDLFKRNGIKRIFIGMGLANALSGCVSGLGQTSYGEGTGCASASKVANARVTAFASCCLIFLGFCAPVQAFMVSIPQCVFAGASLVLYPLIAIAGFRLLINNRIDLNDTKNMVLVSVPLAIGISGIVIGGTTFALSGTALALIVGIILNLILKESKHDSTN